MDSTSQQPLSTAMVYTPQFHIPFAEVVLTEAGNVAIRIKREKKTEVVTLEHFNQLVYRKASEITV